MKRIFRILLELALLGALVGSLALVLRTLVAQEQPGASMGQPYPSPTLRPGPTATPAPLREPANDAAGNILYLASGAQDRAALYSLPMDGQGKVSGAPSKRSEELDVTWGRAYASPDGSRIAVVGEWGASAIIDTASGKLEPMFKDRPNPLGLFLNWYPDSRSMLIRAENNYVDVGLWLVNTDTWEHTPLAVPGYGLVHGAVASPDGRKWDPQLFEDRNICVIDLESGEAHPLLPGNSAGNSQLTWSPDGSQIASVSNRGGTSQIWVVNVDGSNLRQLTSAGKSVRFPLWRRP